VFFLINAPEAGEQVLQLSARFQGEEVFECRDSDPGSEAVDGVDDGVSDESVGAFEGSAARDDPDAVGVPVMFPVGESAGGEAEVVGGRLAWQSEPFGPASEGDDGDAQVAFDGSVGSLGGQPWSYQAVGARFDFELPDVA